MKYNKIREEELKNKVAVDWFKQFDTTEILGNIDFTVFPKQDSLFGRTPLLWAEAKTGNYDIPEMFVQLILTIGKARTFDKTIPPAFLAAFDFKKIAFVPYINIQDIFLPLQNRSVMRFYSGINNWQGTREMFVISRSI